MKSLSNSNVFQNAWVVADFDQAIDWWTGHLGVGPFFALDFESSPGLIYRGEPGELAMRVAWAQAGDTQIELISPQADGGNVYRDLVPPGETRFHHVCFWSDDLDHDVAMLEDIGYPLAMHSGPNPGGVRFAYVDTSAANGHMIELLERQDGMVAMFDTVRRCASEWDGSRPLRSFQELARR